MEKENTKLDSNTVDFFCDEKYNREFKEKIFFYHNLLTIKIDFILFSIFFIAIDTFQLFITKPANNYILVACIVQFIINVSTFMYTFVDSKSSEFFKYF